jgi:hypothetical protein
MVDKLHLYGRVVGVYLPSAKLYTPGSNYLPVWSAVAGVAHPGWTVVGDAVVLVNHGREVVRVVGVVVIGCQLRVKRRRVAGHL